MRPAAEGEELGPVVTRLRNRIGKIETQRTEWRIPDDAGASRSAYERRVGKFHAALANEGPAGKVRDGVDDVGTGDNAVDFPSRRIRRLALVAPHRAGIHEHRAAESGVLGQEVERILELETGAPIVGAADGVVRRSRRDVARAEAGRRKAAHQV